MIPQGDCSTESIIIHRAHAHTANGLLELDQGVGVIVGISWQGFTVLAEVDIMTNSTLVARSSDEALSRLVLAQGPIAEDAIVNSEIMRAITDSLVDRGKSVAWVIIASIHEAVRAVVPVGAGHTLVASANNALGNSQLTASDIKAVEGGVFTLSQPSQMAACLNCRPGRQRERIIFFK